MKKLTLFIAIVFSGMLMQAQEILAFLFNKFSNDTNSHLLFFKFAIVGFCYKRFSYFSMYSSIGTILFEFNNTQLIFLKLTLLKQ